ncbi:hypothetical protein DUNSADRAFT_5482 [Dunaliella salina]|uniref:Uncharacterized protein n=1 Tax=Dunaliella salina TaxID=3046 RepID=A0ABQ7H776_DUNSA|nr:hypothetical protein DUNSADRAFT_5482 [Dunaliella salina]|eukprot:KAF5842715.1 hypothetical protein DUNSADRAFT_5482 [Dunaliella salina]
MSGLTRERSCWYYVPWVVIFGLGILGGAIGVLIHFSILAYEETKDGLDHLGVDALNFDIPYPAVIATACVALAICVLLGLLSLSRSFIEAGHDATVVKSAIDRLLEKFGPESGETSNPGEPCPAQCLNLMYFPFLRDDQQVSCICDYAVLRRANDSFEEASRHSIPLLVGIWVAFLAVLVLLVDFACQYAHTGREKELIRRAHGKQFEIPDYYYKDTN